MVPSAHVVGLLLNPRFGTELFSPTPAGLIMKRPARLTRCIRAVRRERVDRRNRASGASRISPSGSSAASFGGFQAVHSTRADHRAELCISNWENSA
jgi:hypothetical protein